MAVKSALKFGVSTITVAVRVSIIAGLLLLTLLVYRAFFRDISEGSIIIPLLLLWAFTSYIVLPRIHRVLTKLYLPNYYIGRTRTGDGLYGDPVNIGLFSSKTALIKAMEVAGWVRADELSLKSSLKMSFYTLFKKSYPNAPVSSLYLFSKKQDLAFQQEVDGNPHSRHHVRFWRVPTGWRLPGGHDAEWLGAATFDTNVGLSWFTLQFTHKIDMHIDKERDHLVATLKTTPYVQNIEIVENFTTAYHTRNGGGDMVKTDGSMVFVYLND